MAKKRQAPIPKVKTSATVDQQEKSTTKNPETTTLSAGLTSTLISTVIIDEVSPPDARKKQKVGYHKESEDPTPYCPPFVTRDGKIIMDNDSGLANVEVVASALHRARLPFDSREAQNATSAGLIGASYRAIYEMNLYQKNITDWLVELETKNNDLVARMTAIGIAHKEEIQRMETAHKDEVRQMHNLAVESEKKMKDELAVQVAVVDKLRALYPKAYNFAESNTDYFLDVSKRNVTFVDQFTDFCESYAAKNPEFNVVKSEWLKTHRVTLPDPVPDADYHEQILQVLGIPNPEASEERNVHESFVLPGSGNTSSEAKVEAIVSVKDNLQQANNEAMDVLAAADGGILACAGSCMNAPVAVQCRYLRDSTKEIKELKDKKEKLIAIDKYTKEKLKVEVRQGNRRTHETQNWLDKVTAFIAEFDKMEKKFAVGKRYLKGVYPNCHSRLELGSLITKLINEVNDLLERADHISENSLALPIQEIGLVMGTTKLVGEAATQKIMKMVWEHLMDDQVDIIGVYGMGGVGKTTIMKNINDQLIKESTHFSKVVWVTGSKDGNIRKLQMCIGKDFNIDLLSEPDENKWSSQLLTRLPRMGRILFILDDMWEAFSLADIGIPNLKENNCKLVLTTRSLEVCRRMGCKEPIKVELLSEDEAWELFIDIVDKKLEPEVEKVAKVVAAECSRLPLAIVTIASAMKGNEDIQEWRNALSDLRDRTYTNLGMEEKVIGSLKSSYNKLSEPEKKGFQYCALYPKDYKIVSKDLIDHWVMDELISEKRIQRELDRGHGILNRLVHSCMLERDYNKDWEGNCINEFVRMHDLVRDMAIGTAKTNPRFMVKAGLFFGELLDEKEWEEDAEKISFMKCRIEKIVVSPNCPRLTTLLLGGNDKLEYIADTFFARMQNLKVLNLSGSSITSLPESLSELVNLHVLDASGNRALTSVPSLQKLRSLRVLRLQRTGIQELPHGMEALVNLRRLDLSNKGLKEIHVSLITNFSLLQELLIYPCCISFSDPLRSMDSLVEQLLSLSHLERVSLNFNNFSDFICCARSKTFNHLGSISFSVGRDPIGRGIGLNEVYINNNSNAVSENTLVLPQNTEVLEMHGFNEFSCFSESACVKDVRGLRTCRIKDCSGMECILSSSEHRNQLQHLESLRIDRCPKFITLCKGVAAPGILPSLKTLDIMYCSNLKYLFASFKLLKTLRIWYCVELEELIASEEAEEEQVSTEGSNTASPTLLEELVLYNLPKLKTLFSKPMITFYLKELKISWCNGLKYLFSFEMLEHLKHLQYVDIESCYGLEAVIAEAEVGGDSTIILLPSLTELKLSGLPKLNSICRRGEMVCESLQTVDVYWCAKLKRLPLLRGEDQLPPPSLECIKGSSEWWDSLEWDSPFLKTIFQPRFECIKGSSEWWDSLDELFGDDMLFDFDLSQHPSLQGGDRDGDGDDGVIDGGNLQGAQATLNFPHNFRNSSEHVVPPPAMASTSRERTKDIEDKGKALAEEKLIQRQATRRHNLYGN